MKKIAINILVILAIVGITFGATRQWFPKTQQVVQTDTTYIDRPYEVTKIKEVEKPVKVVEYKRDTVEIEKVRVKKDTVYVNDQSFSGEFLLNFPESPRFLGLSFNKPELELSYQKPDGNVRSKIWDVGNKNYEIGLDGSQPNISTYSSSPQFQHSIEAGYIRTFSYSSGYFEYSAEMLILNLNVVGTVNINSRPFGMVGIKKDL